MPIPTFRADGFLPEGVHCAELDEIRERFGSAIPRRRELMDRVELWVELVPQIAIDTSWKAKIPTDGTANPRMKKNTMPFIRGFAVPSVGISQRTTHGAMPNGVSGGSGERSIPDLRH